MTKYKIEFDRELCIGAIACTAVAENFWPRADDGKVDLSGATYNEQTKKWELIIDEKDFEINKDAAEVCPVEAIKITKIEDEQNTNENQEMQNNDEKPINTN
jgi:ferredoxin